MRSILTVVWRLLAFVGKELVETIRRPGAIVSLVLGPFLIMAVFGAGFSGIRRPLETIVVSPASSELPADRGRVPGARRTGPPHRQRRRGPGRR